MKSQIRLTPMRNDEVGRPLILDGQRWDDIVHLVKMHNFDPQYRMAPYQAFQFADALKNGLQELERRAAKTPKSASTGGTKSGLGAYRDLLARAVEAGVVAPGERPKKAEIEFRLAATKSVPPLRSVRNKSYQRLSYLLESVARREVEAVLKLCQRGKGLYFTRQRAW